MAFQDDVAVDEGIDDGVHGSSEEHCLDDDAGLSFQCSYIFGADGEEYDNGQIGQPTDGEDDGNPETELQDFSSWVFSVL